MDEDIGAGSPLVAGGSFEPPRPARRRSIGIWLLALLDLALAGLALRGLRFVGGAESYLRGTSADIGSDLEAAYAGIHLARYLLLVLIGGYILCALGVVSMTRFGRGIQILWSLLIGLGVVAFALVAPELGLVTRAALALVAIVYGTGIVVFFARSSARARYVREAGAG